jgi:hypothetical protein
MVGLGKLYSNTAAIFPLARVRKRNFAAALLQ